MKRLLSLCCLGLLCLSSALRAAPIVLTDIANREVTLPKPASRIVLAQARHLPVLALLHPDPVSLIAGWSDEFKNSFSSDYQAYLEKFPAIARIPVVGRHTADTFSLEQTLALRPDLVVLTAAFAGIAPGKPADTSPLIRRLEAAKVPVLVLDFFIQPMQNSVPSLRLLGKALGREEQAEAFIELYERHMRRVADRVAPLPQPRPTVFVHAHAGSTDCCHSPGTGTFHDMITYAGGQNIGDGIIKSATGRLSLEYVNSRNPAVYVATGTGARQRTSAGLAIGTGATPDAARSSLRRLIAAQGLDSLSAVREGNAHGIWHAFNDSPLHVVFIEALAKWTHPAAFADVSPQATLDEISRRFLPVPMTGAFLIDLDEGRAASPRASP